LKILACIDNSEQSYKALGEAAKIAASMQEEVTVLYVEVPVPHPNDTGYYFSEESLKQYEKRRNKEMEALRAKVAGIFEEKNAKFNIMVKKGHPVQVITEVSAEGDYDVIVMGNRGLGGFKKMLLGSVSSSVVQHAETSVFIVK